ncbi:MAG: C40 family peptidase [Bacteroidetes bacterium]|nr:C40 family peptidase [Bacteroidota bacterium]
MIFRDLKTIFLSTIFTLVSISVFSQVNSVEIDTSAFSFSDTTHKVKKSNPKADAMISFAKSFLGVPYRYGGTTPSGFDCSGFINYIFGNFGFSLVRTSYGLAELGETISLANLQPGDLMFFKGSNVRSTSVGHVAMVIEVLPGDVKFIHAANGGVRIDNLKTKYYVQRYIKSKRLDYGAANKKD